MGIGVGNCVKEIDVAVEFNMDTVEFNMDVVEFSTLILFLNAIIVVIIGQNVGMEMVEVGTTMDEDEDVNGHAISLEIDVLLGINGHDAMVESLITLEVLVIEINVLETDKGHARDEVNNGHAADDVEEIVSIIGHPKEVEVLVEVTTGQAGSELELEQIFSTVVELVMTLGEEQIKTDDVEVISEVVLLAIMMLEEVIKVSELEEAEEVVTVALLETELDDEFGAVEETADETSACEEVELIEAVCEAIEEVVPTTLEEADVDAEELVDVLEVGA